MPRPRGITKGKGANLYAGEPEEMDIVYDRYLRKQDSLDKGDGEFQKALEKTNTADRVYSGDDHYDAVKQTYRDSREEDK